MKKITCVLMTVLLLASILAGCASGDGNSNGENNSAGSSPISVISREDGSGTRGAFIELFGVEQKNDAGEKVDYTTEKAEITSSTAVMITTVEGNKNAIGYISLGSLDESKVKALEIDGAVASVENIKSGTYKVSRPFNIATKGEATGLAKDFIDFIMSEQGQAVVEEAGYISEGNTGAFNGTLPEGSITVGGSSSVTPVMEKLKEAYLALNTAAQIEVQQTDSTAGMSATMEGICDIGMASRELKDSELAELTPTVIALDGIAVIVNLENEVDALTSEQVKAIFTGEVTDWSEINA